VEGTSQGPGLENFCWPIPFFKIRRAETPRRFPIRVRFASVVYIQGVREGLRIRIKSKGEEARFSYAPASSVPGVCILQTKQNEIHKEEDLMKKLLLLPLIAIGLALVPEKQADAQVSIGVGGVGVGFGYPAYGYGYPGYYGYYPRSYYSYYGGYPYYRTYYGRPYYSHRYYKHHKRYYYRY